MGKNKEIRPVIVTVLGHVDHGKTTLLDTIRKSRVASGEAGGITQGIGASVVTTPDGKKITFVDTPGHAAFNSMRSRGAKLADIAVLVVAADDGVMPQTKEAIGYILEAEIPLVVAITKTDLPSANPESVKSQLEKEGIFLEGRGGDTPVALVSARKGVGIKELLELINLVAEVHGIKGDKVEELEGVVIETSKDRRGLLVSVVLWSGMLKVGEDIFSEGKEIRVRGIFDDMGKSVKSIEAGMPGLVLGFSDLPEVGSKIFGSRVRAATSQSDGKPARKREESSDERPSLIVKAQNQGALEAILANLGEKVTLIASGIGDVNESDIFLAKSSGAYVFLFATKVSSNIKRLADMEDVKIESFEIIYELFKRIEELTHVDEEIILGKAEILKAFPYEETKKIAGSRLLEGEISKQSKLVLMRGEVKLGDVRVVSLRKAKKEIDSIKKGEEFGIYFEPQLDFQPRDVLLSISKASK